MKETFVDHRNSMEKVGGSVLIWEKEDVSVRSKNQDVSPEE